MVVCDHLFVLSHSDMGRRTFNCFGGEGGVVLSAAVVVKPLWAASNGSLFVCCQCCWLRFGCMSVA